MRGPGCHHVHGLRHRKSNAPGFVLWNKIRGLRRSAHTALRHEAWLEFLSIRKSSSESYTAYPILLDAAYVKIERITPENQTSAQCSEELSVFRSSISRPYSPTLTTQYLTLAKATEAYAGFDTGHKTHPADGELASATKYSR